MDDSEVTREAWLWLVLFLLIVLSIVSNSFYFYVVYGDLHNEQSYISQQTEYEQEQYEEQMRQQQQEEYYQEHRENELQEQYEQEQYEEQMRQHQQEEYYGGKEQQDRYSDEQSVSQNTLLSVAYVLDGDSIQLSDGEEVRLLGINAPETGERCYEEAKEGLQDMVLGKQITLESDVEDKDEYGRALRYVYADGVFVNLEMVRLGFAHKYEYGPNVEYSTLFEQAESEAKQNEGCLWKTADIDYIQDQCIQIIDFHFNAAGNDNYNLNDEYVTFGNWCSYSINMTDWTIKDETASHDYTIPSFILEGGATFTLYTGRGSNTGDALYWGRTPGNYAAIWNNGGDTLFLRDSNGNLVLTQSYAGY